MAALTVAFAVLLSCSSDEVTPLGTEFVDDLLGSMPGTVFEDTAEVVSDTVLAFGTAIIGLKTLEFGRANGYVRTMILQPDFRFPGDDTSRTVLSADLRLLRESGGSAMPARFYMLRNAYAEGDTISDLDTLYAILDPNTSSPQRILTTFPVRYALPPALVQGWIQGDSLSTAIAIVYTDDVVDNTALYGSRTSTNPDIDKVTVKVTFADGGDEETYSIRANATYVRPTPANTTNNLIVSDGYVRRIYFRIDLSGLSDSAATHTAHIRMHIVPGTVSGDDPTVILYVPDTDDFDDPDFVRGLQIVSRTVNEVEGFVDFTITNTLLGILSDVLPGNGFGLRFAFENTAIRTAEFYSTAADDTLRPRVFITSSTPAEFDR